MRTVGNILWILFGGALLALLWALAGLLCCLTIVGIPLGLQCFKFAGFVLHPFGRTVLYSSRTGHFVLNLLWLLLCGWELAVASFCVGALWCLTIVGIPFGLQSFKFAQLAAMPFGARVVRIPV